MLAMENQPLLEMVTAVRFETAQNLVRAVIDDPTSLAPQPRASSQRSDVDALADLIRTTPGRFPGIDFEFSGTYGDMSVAVYVGGTILHGRGETADEALAEVIVNHIDQMPLVVSCGGEPRDYLHRVPCEERQPDGRWDRIESLQTGLLDRITTE